MRRTRRYRRDERGAVALLSALLCVVLMMSAAFVVDIGMQRVARADLQALADVIALDLARDLDGRPADEQQPDMETAAQVSLQRNRDVLGDEVPRLTVRLGDVGVGGGFVASTTDQPPSAVQVVAATTVERRFAQVVGAEPGGAQRAAVAAVEESACYTVGSYAAAVNSQSSAILDPLMDKLAEQTGAFNNGWAVGQAIGYQGLAAADVRLGDVAAALGIGSVSELATASVTLKQWFTALKASVAPGSAAASMLGVAEQWAKTSVSVAIGKVVGLDSGSSALADLRANVLDVVLSSLYAVNGTNAADLYVSSGLERLSYLGVKVRAIQGPHLYCGRVGSTFTTGSAPDTEQLHISGQGILNPVTVTTPIPAIPGVTQVGATLSAPMWSNMPFSLSVASTDTALTAIRCDPAGISLDVTNRLARLTLTDVQFSEASFDTTLRLEVGPLELVNLAVRITVGNANASSIVVDLGSSGTEPVDIDAYDTPQATHAAGISTTATLKTGVSVRVSAKANLPVLGIYAGADLGNALVSQADRLLIAQTVVDAVVDASFDLANLDSLTHKVVAPLLSLAGVRLGGSDVTLLSRPPVQCGTPRLRG